MQDFVLILVCLIDGPLTLLQLSSLLKTECALNPTLGELRDWIGRAKTWGYVQWRSPEGGGDQQLHLTGQGEGYLRSPSGALSFILRQMAKIPRT